MAGTTDRRPRFEGAEPIVIVKDVAPEVRVHHVRKLAPLAYLGSEEYEDVPEHQDARQL